MSIENDKEDAIYLEVEKEMDNISDEEFDLINQASDEIVSLLMDNYIVNNKLNPTKGAFVLGLSIITFIDIIKNIQGESFNEDDENKLLSASIYGTCQEIEEVNDLSQESLSEASTFESADKLETISKNRTLH